MQLALATACAAAWLAFAQPAPGPQPSPGAPPSAGPSASATPAPGTPSATPSPAVPGAFATPTYRYIYVPSTPPGAPDPAAEGAPQIREIDLSDQTLVTPGELRVRVLTTPDVVSVVARAVGRELSLPQIAPGQFGLSTQVPAVPFYLKRTYQVEFVATVPNGRTASVTLQLGLH